MKKTKNYVCVLLGFLLLTGCSSPKDSEKQKEESVTENAIVAATNENTSSAEQAESGSTASSETESDEELSAKVDALMTVFQQQETEADALPYLQKMYDLIDKMQKPGLKTVIITMGQMIHVDAAVNGLDRLDTNLDWAIGQLDRVSVETVTAEDLMAVITAIAHMLDKFQYLTNGPGKVTPFVDKMNDCIEKVVACHQDNPELPMLRQLRSSFEWMAAWNAILNKDYKKADEYLISAHKYYQNIQAEMDSLLKDSNENTVSEFLNSQLAHFDFLRAFILYETDKKDEAFNLFRQGIENDLNHTQGMYGKNLYSQLQVLEIQGHDISGLVSLREELETRLKDVLEKGIEVARCVEGSVAEKVGIKEGDRVVKYDGWYVCDMSDFSKQRWAEHVQPTGKTVTITILSNGESRDLEVPSGRLGMGIKDVE